MLAQMKVYFPLLYAEWRIWTYENSIECKQKCKIDIESELRANVRSLALMNASSRYWSSIHANECIFSHNGQQKVYLFSTTDIYWEQMIL